MKLIHIQESIKMFFNKSKNIKFKFDNLQAVNVHETIGVDWIVSKLLETCLLNSVTCYKHSIYTESDDSKEFMAELLSCSPFFMLLQKTDSKSKEKVYFNSSDAVITFETRASADDDSTSIQLYTTNKDLYDKVCKIKRKKSNKKKSIYVIGQTSRGPSLEKMGSIKEKFVVENYHQDVINSYNYVLKEFNSEKPAGRLVIVNGRPGTGKSYMLRSLISQIKDSIIVLLPAKLVSEMDSPSIISLLMSERSEYGVLSDEKNTKSILFIVEDADNCLVSRDASNALSISTLLNFTDGIFGSTLDMRIIATTNAEELDFDKALMRPGRLCRHIRVDSLEADHATQVYERLTKEPMSKPYTNNKTLGEIYSEAHNKDNDADTKQKKIGFGV